MLDMAAAPCAAQPPRVTKSWSPCRRGCRACWRRATRFVSYIASSASCLTRSTSPFFAAACVSDADGGTHSLHLDSGHGVVDPVRHPARVRLVGVGHHSDELVTTRPRQQVAPAQDAGHGPGHGDEDPVADFMPVLVVDALEPVDVQDENAHGAVSPVTLEVEREAPAIGQPREGIGVGLHLEILVGDRVTERELDDVAQGAAPRDDLLDERRVTVLHPDDSMQLSVHHDRDEGDVREGDLVRDGA